MWMYFKHSLTVWAFSPPTSVPEASATYFTLILQKNLISSDNFIIFCFIAWKYKWLVHTFVYFSFIQDVISYEFHVSSLYVSSVQELGLKDCLCLNQANLLATGGGQSWQNYRKANYTFTYNVLAPTPVPHFVDQRKPMATPDNGFMKLLPQDVSRNHVANRMILVKREA